MILVVEKAALGQDFFSEYIGFPLSAFQQCFILIFTYILLLPGQAGEAWERCEKYSSFGNQKQWI
jgi:hypothetical protein